MRRVAPGADAAIRVLGRLKHQHSGEPKPLEGWQKFVVRKRYGADPGSTIVFIIPRGAAKTTLSGGLGVIDLWQTPNANGYSAATSLTQAEELFRHAAYFARQGKDLTVRPSTRVIRHADGGFLRVLAADLTGRRTGAAQGYAPTYVALDELQAWRAMSMYVDLQTSLFKRGGVLLVTGLPADRGHPLTMLRTQAMAGRVESGLLCDDDGYSYTHPDGRMTVAEADGIIWIEWGLRDGEDWRDPAVVKLANPASWITVPMLAQGLTAPGVPEWALRTMRAGMWLDVGATDWLPPHVLGSMWAGDPILAQLDDVDGTEWQTFLTAQEDRVKAQAALDAVPPNDPRLNEYREECASSLTMAAVGLELARKRVDEIRGVCKTWAQTLAAESTGKAAAAVDMGRYRDRTAVTVIAQTRGEFLLHGSVTGSDHTPTPYELVEELARALHEAFGKRLLGIAWDPKYLDESASRWARDGLPMVQVPQSQDRQVVQSRQLRDAFVTEVLRTDGNADLADHANNVKVVQVGGGMAWKIGRGTGPVDAMVSGAMAWDLLQRQGRVEPWIL